MSCSSVAINVRISSNDLRNLSNASNKFPKVGELLPHYN